MTDVMELDKKVSEYTNGAFSTYDMEIFVPEVEKLKPGDIYLEIGVDRGKSLLTAYLAAKEGVRVIGVDIVDKPERQEVFTKFVIDGRRMMFIHADSVEASKIFRGKIKLLFIDGNHSYEYCNRDIWAWERHMSRRGVILFHDCDISSPGVQQAVDEHFRDKVQLFSTPERRTSMAKVQL